jgi:hypothetical protein
MARAIRFGNCGVYVYDERGAPHHRPHAHIKHRGRRIASIFLETLVVFDQVEPVPGELLEEIRAQHEVLIDLWLELNDDA